MLRKRKRNGISQKKYKKINQKEREKAMKTKYLEKIIDYTKSKERVEKNKYFTEEFF